MNNSLRSIFRASAAGLGLLALAACESMPVTTDYNPAVGVGACRTYAFAQEHTVGGGQGSSAYGNPLNGDRLRAAIESNLAARGIQRVEARAPADCVVGYSIGSRLVADEWAGANWGWGWGGGYGWGWGRRGFGGAMGYDWPYVYNEGRIAIDVFDAKTRKAIWHASVNQDVVDLTGPHAEAKINAAAAAIFAKFPVAAPAPAPAGAPAAAPTAMRSI